MCAQNITEKEYRLGGEWPFGGGFGDAELTLPIEHALRSVTIFHRLNQLTLASVGCALFVGCFFLGGGGPAAVQPTQAKPKAHHTYFQSSNALIKLHFCSDLCTVMRTMAPH